MLNEKVRTYTDRNKKNQRNNSLKKSLITFKDKIKDCEWNEPHLAEVVVALSEDDQNQLTVTEDLANIRQMILSRIPEQGFLSVSAAGDLALIRRHEMAIKRLQDQGG